MLVDSDEVRYLVLADRAVPYLLARVRWPDVAQAISAARPDWLDDPGLFDLPYDDSAVTVSFAQAASVAEGWGRHLHTEPAEDAPYYIRRMPADWSDLSPSERRTWGIEFVGRPRGPARRRRPWRPDTVTRAGSGAPARAPAPVNGQVGGDLTPAGHPDERRRHERVPLAARAHIRCEHITLTAGLVDLSETGVRCVLPEAMPLIAPGSTFTGPFLFDAEVDTSRICLDVGGRISWHETTGAGSRFGVAFDELADGETEGVQRLLVAAGRKRGNR
jgi:PilZ domain